MTNLGLPVPPGFTITTEACRVYTAAGIEPPELREEMVAHLVLGLRGVRLGLAIPGCSRCRYGRSLRPSPPATRAAATREHRS